MKTKFYTLLITTLFIGTINTSAQVNTFRNVFGGVGDDFGQDIEQTADGGYVITGATGSFGYGQSDVYLLKIDSLGIYEWSRSYGGSNIDWGYDVEITSDGGYVIAGYTNSFGAGGYDFYLLKTDSIGDTLWTKTYGGWNWDRCFSMDITSDDGFVLVGETYSYGAGETDVWIVKADAFGDTLWTKTFGGNLEERANSVFETYDGSLIICGNSNTYSDGGADGIILKIDNLGNTEWFSNYGGPENQNYNSVIQYYDTTGYICFGTNNISSTQSKMYMTKFDNFGIFEWDKQYGNGTINTGSAVSNRGSGSMVVAGTNDNSINSIEVLVTSPTGGFWANNANIGGNDADVGNDIILTSDNHFAILGNTKSFGFGYSDILVYKSSSSIESDSSNYTSQLDTNTVKYPIPFTGLSENNLDKNITIYPIPSSNNKINLSSKKSIIDAKLYNILGQLIPIVLHINNNLATIENLSLVKGIYLLELNLDGQVVYQQVVFE